MDLKLIELLFTTPAIFMVFAVAVWILTNLVKKPIKKQTEKIKDPQKRKLINKWILAIPFLIALVISVFYNRFTIGLWFDDLEGIMSRAFLIATSAILIYNFVEGLKGKKTEYETTEDGIAVFNILMVYAKDKGKVKLLLDQCKQNLETNVFTIDETVKGFLPADTPPELINTIVKSVEKYFKERVKVNEN